MVSNRSRSTCMPPWRSASVTTPTGSDTQARTSGVGGPPRRGTRASEPYQFRRAAADVEQDDAARPADRSAGCSRWPRARASVSRSTISSSMPTFSRTRARKSAPFAAARHASVAIRRARVTPRLLHLVAADGERIERALDRGFAQHARRRDALAQPDDAGERVDDAKAVVGRPGDQEAAIVGAEIERRIGAARPSCRDSWRACRRPRRPHGRAPVLAARTGPGAKPRASSSIDAVPAAPKPSGSTVAALVFHDPHQCTSDGSQATATVRPSAANLKFRHHCGHASQELEFKAALEYRVASALRSEVRARSVPQVWRTSESGH